MAASTLPALAYASKDFGDQLTPVARRDDAWVTGMAPRGAGPPAFLAEMSRQVPSVQQIAQWQIKHQPPSNEREWLVEVPPEWTVQNRIDQLVQQQREVTEYTSEGEAPPPKPEFNGYSEPYRPTIRPTAMAGHRWGSPVSVADTFLGMSDPTGFAPIRDAPENRPTPQPGFAPITGEAPGITPDQGALRAWQNRQQGGFAPINGSNPGITPDQGSMRAWQNRQQGGFAPINGANPGITPDQGAIRARQTRAHAGFAPVNGATPGVTPDQGAIRARQLYGVAAPSTGPDSGPTGVQWAEQSGVHGPQISTAFHGTADTMFNVGPGSAPAGQRGRGFVPIAPGAYASPGNGQQAISSAQLGGMAGYQRTVSDPFAMTPSTGALAWRPGQLSAPQQGIAPVAPGSYAFPNNGQQMIGSAQLGGIAAPNGSRPDFTPSLPGNGSPGWQAAHAGIQQAGYIQHQPVGYIDSNAQLSQPGYQSAVQAPWNSAPTVAGLGGTAAGGFATTPGHAGMAPRGYINPSVGVIGPATTGAIMSAAPTNSAINSPGPMYQQFLPQVQTGSAVSGWRGDLTSAQAPFYYASQDPSIAPLAAPIGHNQQTRGAIQVQGAQAVQQGWGYNPSQVGIYDPITGTGPYIRQQARMDRGNVDAGDTDHGWMPSAPAQLGGVPFGSGGGRRPDYFVDRPASPIVEKIAAEELGSFVRDRASIRPADARESRSSNAQSASLMSDLAIEM